MISAWFSTIIIKVYHMQSHENFSATLEALSKHKYNLPHYVDIACFALLLAYPTFMYFKEKKLRRINHDK